MIVCCAADFNCAFTFPLARVARSRSFSMGVEITFMVMSYDAVKLNQLECPSLERIPENPVP